MSLNFCDLLVLGSDLSGLLAATVLAKRGLKVIVMDDDHDWDRKPNVIHGLQTRAFKSLLGKLNIPESKLNIVQENEVSCQVVFPQHRIDLFTTRDLLLKEISREFPKDRENFETLLRQIDTTNERFQQELLSFFPIINQKEKKRFLKAFENFPEDQILDIWESLSQRLKTTILAQIKFLSEGFLGYPLSVQLLLFLNPEHAKTFSIKGGLPALKKVFYDRLDYFGGLVQPMDEHTYDFHIQKKKVQSVGLGGLTFETKCRYLLGNVPAVDLYEKMPARRFRFLPLIPSNEKSHLNKMQISEKKSILQYHIASDLLPSPMKENVLLIQDAQAPLRGENYVELNLASLPRSQVTEVDRILTVSFYLSPEEKAQPEVLKNYHKRIETQIRKLIPFTDHRFFRVFPKEEQGNELFPEQDNDWSKLEKYTHKRSIYQSNLYLPNLTTSCENFFITGPQTLGWMGLQGKLLAASRAVELIWQEESKKRDPS